MPIYEYRCEECGERFERRVEAARAAEVRCPSGHDRVVKLLPVFATLREEASSSGGCGCGGNCACRGAS